MGIIDTTRELIPPGAKVLCAVSGGADSVCLLHMLSQREDISLVAAHFNHQLRGEEADRDEQFVRELCGRWDIPFTVGRGDVKAYAQKEKRSIEEAGRSLRYDFLIQTAETEGCGLIATAHNADDNAETILMHLIRGTSLHGLTGIPSRRDNIVRPLLGMTHSEILTYLDQQGIPHQEDSSNADEAYTRNRIRHQVIPILRELNPRAVEHINLTARQLGEVDQFLEKESQRLTAQAKVQNGRLEFPFLNYRRTSPEILSRILLQLLDKFGVGRKDITAKHLHSLQHMMTHSCYSCESRMDLPHGITARCYWNTLILETRPQKLTQLHLMEDLPVHWGSYTLTLSAHGEGEGLSLQLPDKAHHLVSVAPCPPGERLALPGSNGARTVKRLCLDRRISLSERDELPAIYVDDRLAAVWRLGVDTAFSPGPNKTFCRFIQIKKNNREDEQNERE